MKILEDTRRDSHEAELILNDLFQDDIQARNDAINELSERFGIENPEEIASIIVSEEDALYERYYPSNVEEE